MHASGFLVPPHESPTIEQSYLWNATFERIDPVLNTLKIDLFPPSIKSDSRKLEEAKAKEEANEVVNEEG